MIDPYGYPFTARFIPVPPDYPYDIPGHYEYVSIVWERPVHPSVMEAMEDQLVPAARDNGTIEMAQLGTTIEARLTSATYLAYPAISRPGA